MNIAHLLPYSAVFPLKKHNGRYQWALRLARKQAAAGHNVSIYAGPSSTDDSNITWHSLPTPASDKTTNNRALIEQAFANDTIDIYHSHFDSLAFALADHTKQPVVTTQHWFPTNKIAGEICAHQHRNAIAVPVTRYMAVADAEHGIPTTDVIYHGIDLSLFHTVSSERSDRFLFVGRIAPHKGVLETVQLAKNIGIKLDIVGKINDADMAYWHSIEPLVDGDTICYLGAKPQTEVAELMASARSLLFMPNQPEAFGQTIIESQACGTPVIVNNSGSNSELVHNGVTGYVTDSDADVLAAVQNISSITHENCRAWAEHFNINTMVASYEALYEKLLTVG